MIMFFSVWRRITFTEKDAHKLMSEKKISELKLHGEYMNILSCFPGIGKTYLFNNQEKYGLRILDSDSSNFSWIEKGKRNPAFPQNYIEHIKENMFKVDVILVSTHKEVREALVANIHPKNLRFVVPPFTDIDVYIERYRKRGSSESFIKLLSDNWYDWILDIVSSHRDSIWMLDTREYLSDLFDRVKFDN